MLWIDKYAPKTQDECVTSRQKFTEMQRTLSLIIRSGGSTGKVFLVVGPPGCGKTSAFKVSMETLFQLPCHILNVDCDTSQDLEIALGCALQCAAGVVVFPNILPIVYTPQQREGRDRTLLRFANAVQSRGILTCLIHTYNDVHSDVISIKSTFPDSFLNHPSVTVMHFRPATEVALVKRLKAIAALETGKPHAELATGLAAASEGDIRSAMLRMQWSLLCGSPTTATLRDAYVNIGHATARLLCGKTEERHVTSNVIQSLPSTPPPKLLSYFHNNMHRYFSEENIERFSESLHAIAKGDVINTLLEVNSGYSGGGIRGLDQLGLEVAVMQYRCSNATPEKMTTLAPCVPPPYFTRTTNSRKELESLEYKDACKQILFVKKSEVLGAALPFSSTTTPRTAAPSSSSSKSTPKRTTLFSFQSQSAPKRVKVGVSTALLQQVRERFSGKESEYMLRDVYEQIDEAKTAPLYLLDDDIEDED